MNIDARDFLNINDINNMNKNASVQGNYVASPDCTEAFFDDEHFIKKADNTNDAYDRIVMEVENDKSGEMAVTPDVIQQLADVVTPENYSKYEELGIAPDKDNPTEILTVAERIEIELAVHCEDYKPVGNISADDLENMYGSMGAVNINRDMSEYILVNNLPLNIDNIYKAQYSVSGSRSESYQKLSDSQWEELKPQIEKMLDNNGIEISDRNLENAKWLVEEKIPVTVENIYKLNQIDIINSSGEYYNNIAATSVEAREIIENGNEEQITTLVLDGKDVTLLNMKRVEEENTNKAIKERKEYISDKSDKEHIEYSTENADNTYSTSADRFQKENNITENQKKQITIYKKNLEELRLKMTADVSVMMMKKGINIEILSLSNLVEELKKTESEYAMSVFEATGNVADAKQLDLFTDTTEVMKQFSMTPAYVMGNVLNQEIQFQVEDMVAEGRVSEQSLREAERAYETLGTKPDKELGDSLNKAFGNIDSILEELGEDITPDNQRAVRILAYNQMEITNENIRQVKEMDMEVTRLIDNLTPRTAVYLISNGINPLKTNINELNDELDKIKEEIGDDTVEQYSEFLWKLDKNKQISREDRDAYIGIYRVIKMIEKGDRRAVGAVVKQGADMTMRNLLTAARSLKHTGREAAVDDQYGVQEEFKLSDNNIDNQLMQLENSVYLKRAKDVISPENIKNVLETAPEGMDMSLEEFVDKMSQESSDNEEERMYYNQLKSQELNDIQTISEEIFMHIVEDGAAKNMHNVLGVSYYVMNGGKVFSKIQSVCDDEEVDRDVEDLEGIFDSEADESELSDKVKEMCQDIKDILISKSQISTEDIRMVNRTADYIRRATDNGTYYVPADINGEKTTIKVTLNADTDNKGKIDIRIHRESKDIQVQMDIRDRDAKVLISSGDEDIQKLGNFKSVLEAEFEKKDINIKAFGMTTEHMPVRNTGNEGRAMSSGELFTIAKVCICCIKNCL